METTILAIILSALGSSGLWSFLSMVIDKKSGMRKQLDEIQNELKSLKCKIDENEAKEMRIRIINFADEMRVRDLSSEAWMQVLRDIDGYESYCEANPTFKNSYAKLSIELIKDKYEEEKTK